MVYEYCLKIHFPEEAAQEMENAYQALIGDDAIRAMMEDVKTSMVTPGDGRFLTIVNQIAQKSGIHPYTVSMVSLLASLDAGRKKYQEKGYSETLFWESAEALTTKLWECKQVYDIWGTFVVDALKLVLDGSLLRIGRLEYMLTSFQKEEYRGIVKKGDCVLGCHIPSSGPLTTDLVLDSLKRAYDYYPEARYDGKLVVNCHSWLLYPPHYELFPDSGNMRKFYELFDVIDSTAIASNHNFWRIFGRNYDPSILDQVPADTRLRRNFLEFLKAGNVMGNGYGMLVFDGEKIV